MQKILNYYYELLDRLNRWFWNLSSRRSKVNGLFLMYHHISDSIVGAIPDCHHTIDEFLDSLRQLIDKGYTFVSIQQAMEIIENRNKEKFAVVTFDDVPRSAYENAVPILNSMNIPYVFFITTGFLNTAGFLSDSELKKLDMSPLCTIGSHTVTHPQLRLSKNSLWELSESKCYLEKLLGHSVDYFAYPYGRHSSVSQKVMREARDAGYKCALGTIFAVANDNSIKNVFYLPRVVVKSEVL